MPALTFRTKLLLAMMVIVIGVTGATTLLTKNRVEATYQSLFRAQFESEMQFFAELHAIRLHTVTNRCLALVRAVRVQAAIRDGDTNELYGSVTQVELKDALQPPGNEQRMPGALFYYFTDADGALLRPDPGSAAFTNLTQTQGALVNASLGYTRLVAQQPEQQQFGYLGMQHPGGNADLVEVIATKILDVSEDNLFVGILVMGFPAVDPGSADLNRRPSSHAAVLLEGKLYSETLPPAVAVDLIPRLSGEIAENPSLVERSVVRVSGMPHRVFYRRLSSSRAFPAAHQINLYSLAEAQRTVRQFIWGIFTFGLAGLLGAFLLSLALAHGLSVPIRELVRGTGEIQAGNFTVTVPVRTRDELGVLASSFNDMAKGLGERERFRSLLNKVSDKKVAEELMKRDATLGGEQREISVLFCDIRGFTALTQDMPPGEVIQMLNEHFTPLTQVVNQNEGMVDKFVGDLIMAVFGAPFRHGDDARNAVNCALQMMQERERLNATSQHKIRMGIGIATGSAVAGCMGSADRLNYTALGERVNLASRLCGQAGAMEIVIDQTTQKLMADFIETEPLPLIKLKGYSAPVQAYKVRAGNAPRTGATPTTAA